MPDKRVLIVHCETIYFAGAQKVLGYFLDGLSRSHCEALVAAAGTRIREVIPSRVRMIEIPNDQRRSLAGLIRQVRCLARIQRQERCDIIHGWTARDWEVASLAGWMSGQSCIGTLHDHPRARFISRKRQWLMRWFARLGLDRVVCVSDAVRRECLAAGYSGSKLAIIHNGLPSRGDRIETSGHSVFRLGFLGAFSERKGLQDLFPLLDALHARIADGWEVVIAGGAPDEPSRQFLSDLQLRFESRSWWKRVAFVGWVNQPAEFLQSLDLLLFSSPEFDPFPTVLLEAGQAGIPVLATRVGGVAEIVEDGVTGWLMEVGDYRHGVEIIIELMRSPSLGKMAGRRAVERIGKQFAVERMVEQHLQLYADVRGARQRREPTAG